MRPATLRYLQRVGLGLCVVVLALGVAAGAWKPDFIDRFDAILYDARLRATMPGTLDERVVIVDIDEASLAEYGRWPWSRHHLARLIDVLFDEQGIALLGFDVVFAEPDDSSGLGQLQVLAQGDMKDDPVFQRHWARWQQTLDYDRQFARAIENRPVILGYYLTSDRQGHRSGKLPAPVIDPRLTGDPPFHATTWSGYGSNIPLLTSAAPQAGFFNPIVDVDGMVRSVPLLARHEDRYYESLTLAMYRALLGLPTVRPGFPADVPFSTAHPYLSHVLLDQDGAQIAIPVDHRAAVLVPYRGRGGPDGGSFTYVSAADVLARRLPPRSLEGAIVLVGTTAPGLLDLRATPVGEVYPGVEVHANLLAGLLDGQMPVRPDYAMGFDAVTIALSGLLLSLVLPALGAWRSILLTLGTLAAVTGLNIWLYSAANLALPLATVLLTGLVIFSLNILYGYFVESRSKRELAQLFGSYVPPELVEEMVKEPERYSMQAQEKELTVMFSDMRGFTSLSETMEPQALQRLLNEVFTQLSRCIREHQGTIDKFMGDCVMAFWGAPVDTPAHARRAVETALAMRATIKAINARHQEQDLPTIGMGIGLHTGLMCVGDMGSDLRRSYTVIGDAVNLGSRLEGLGKLYGVDIVVSAATRHAAGDGYVWQELDKVRVKGKDEAVVIYTLWGRTGDAEHHTASALAHWTAFLRAYRARQWATAREHLDAYATAGGLPQLCAWYAQRLADWATTPPAADWDGSTRLDSK